MARHSPRPPAQRVDLVPAVIRGTENLEVLDRRHPVSTNTLRRWRDEFVAADRDDQRRAVHGPAGRSDQGSPPVGERQNGPRPRRSLLPQ